MRSDRLRRAASFESEEVTLPESDVKNASRLVSRPDDDPYLVRTRPYDLLRCLHDDVRERNCKTARERVCQRARHAK